MPKSLRLSFPQLASGLFCLVFLFAIVQGFASKRRFLLEPFASTEAVVYSTERYNHGKLDYSYTVEGKSFVGVGSGSVDLGAKIKVFYLLSDPSVSTHLDPSGGFTGLFGTALASGLSFSLLSSAMLYCFARYVLARRTQPPVA